MHDLLHRTGPYLHAPDDLLRLRFETGGTPRLFTVLIASAVERDRIDRSGAGIVVLDEDEGSVLLDRHLGDDPARCGSELYRIRSLSWPDFSGFCRAHPRYRGGSVDIVTPHDAPLPGSRRRQAALPGPEPEAAPVNDLRSDLMMRADLDPTCPVRFPTRDRSGALADLSERIIPGTANGQARIGWPVQLPAGSNLSGAEGPNRVDRAMDPAWTDLLDRRPELIEEARTCVLEALVSGQVSTWGGEDEGRYDLRLEVAEPGLHVVLFALDETTIGAETPSRLSEQLQTLPQRDLRDLWKLSRTLDHETGPSRVMTGFTSALNRIRAELESSRDPDLSPSGP